MNPMDRFSFTDDDVEFLGSGTVTSSIAVTEHNHPHIPAIKNQFDEESQGVISAQQGMLQNAVVNIEEEVAVAVLNKVTKNQFEEQSDIMSEREKQDFIDELAIVLGGFYGVILPIYAKSTMSRRAAEFGLLGNFKLNNDVKKYIKTMADKGAESHINTILKDFLGTIQQTHQKLVKEEFSKLVEAEKSKLPLSDQDDFIKQLTAKGKDSDIYRLAQRKALEGSGRQEIISAIKNEYKDVSTNRAKVIAHTETNRVFTQSQYQADLQFIKQNHLEGRAYKKWITRSGHPCQLCVKEASKPPILFDKPFFDLGDEASVTYEENGKTKVLKQKINYEVVEAGNLHVGCFCIYQLIIM